MRTLSDRRPAARVNVLSLKGSRGSPPMHANFAARAPEPARAAVAAKC